MTETIRKAGRLIPYTATGGGPIERVCSMACCAFKSRFERRILLPCACHSTFVKCTCPLNEAHCNKCGRNFITTAALKGKEWFEIADPHPGTIDTEPYGIKKTPAVRRELSKVTEDQGRKWLEELKARGPWWPWKLKSKPKSKAHIARKWGAESALIGTCCSMQYHASDMMEIHPSYPDVEICGTCQRNAAKNGIEIGNYQPRL